MPQAALQFLDLIEEARTRDDLAAVMRMATAALGFDHFALIHHVDDVQPRNDAAIFIHDYPTRWADFYAENALAVSDPVHRASHVTSRGFLWSDMPRMIPMTPQDHRLLALGLEQGIGTGFTVPANVLGEARGSCTFAAAADRPPPKDTRLVNLIGIFAFEGARRLWTRRGQVDPARAARLTDRQRDCVVWAARGKSDWEISRILAISEETVTRHIKHACARYQVNKRILLVGRTLLDGTLTITDIVGQGYAPFWA